MPEVAEGVLEPRVDLVQGQLFLRWLHDRLSRKGSFLFFMLLIPCKGRPGQYANYLSDQRGVGERWPDIRIAIKVSVPVQLWKFQEKKDCFVSIFVVVVVAAAAAAAAVVVAVRRKCKRKWRVDLFLETGSTCFKSQNQIPERKLQTGSNRHRKLDTGNNRNRKLEKRKWLAHISEVELDFFGGGGRVGESTGSRESGSGGSYLAAHRGQPCQGGMAVLL